MAHASLFSSVASLAMLKSSETTPMKTPSFNDAGQLTTQHNDRKKKKKHHHKHVKPHSDQQVSSNTTPTPAKAKDILVGESLPIQDPPSVSAPGSSEQLTGHRGEQSRNKPPPNRRTKRWDNATKGNPREHSRQGKMSKKKGLRENGRRRRRGSNPENELDEKQEKRTSEPTSVASETAKSTPHEASSLFPSVSTPSTAAMTPLLRKLFDSNEAISPPPSLSPPQEEEKEKVELEHVAKGLPSGTQGHGVFQKTQPSSSFLPGDDVEQASPLPLSLRVVSSFSDAAIGGGGKDVGNKVPPSSFKPNSPTFPGFSSSSVTPTGGPRRLRAEAEEFHPVGLSCEVRISPLEGFSGSLSGLHAGGGSQGTTFPQPLQVVWHSHRPAATPSLSFPSPSVSDRLEEEEEGRRNILGAASSNTFMGEVEPSSSNTLPTRGGRLSGGLKYEFPSAPRTQTPTDLPKTFLEEKKIVERCTYKNNSSNSNSSGNAKPPSAGVVNFSPISFSSRNASSQYLGQQGVLQRSPFPPDDEKDGKGSPRFLSGANPSFSGWGEKERVEKEIGGRSSSSPRQDRGDTVRLTQLAIADDVAQDEVLMYDLLADAEDLEDEILYFREKEEEARGRGAGGTRNCFCFSPSSANGDWETRSTVSTRSHVRHESRLGGYWSLDGPRVMEASGFLGVGNPQLPPQASSMFTIDYDEYGDIWRVESSSEEDSLDEEQVQWIEEQLRSNENPKAFF